MLTNPTLENMYTLGLSGMAMAWRELSEQPDARAMNKEEWLGLMLDREIAVRADK
ncbi:AAA family ATPase, partial [Brucella anthropi]